MISFGLLFSIALASAPAGPSCAGRMVKAAEPGTLKQKVRKLDRTEALTQVLEELGWPEPFPAAGRSCEQAPSLKADVFMARLVDATTEDTVIQLRGNACGEAALFGLVLHPLPGTGQVCASRLPFLPGPLGELDEVKFAFIQVTDPARQAIRVDTSDADSNGTRYGVELWEFQEGRPVRIFEHEHYDQEVGSSHSETEYQLIAEADAFPRRLLEVQTVTSDTVLQDLRDQATETRQETWCFRPRESPRPGEAKVAYSQGCKRQP